MRVWDIPPGFLCRKHLLGEHREIHSVFTVIDQDREGYSKHPETLRWVGKLAALKARHDEIVAEMTNSCACDCGCTQEVEKVNENTYIAGMNTGEMKMNEEVDVNPTKKVVVDLTKHRQYKDAMLKLTIIMNKCLQVNITSYIDKVDYIEINEQIFEESIRYSIGLNDDEDWEEFKQTGEYKGMLKHKKIYHFVVYVTNHVGCIVVDHYDFIQGILECYDCINEDYNNILEI